MRNSTRQIKALISEGGHRSGCTCGFCRNKGSFGKKKKDDKEKEPDEPKEPEEPKESPMSEGRDDIGKLPFSKQGKAYARRSGLASMKQQPKQYINMVAKETNQSSKKGGFKNYDAEEMSTGGALGSKNIVTKKRMESRAQQLVKRMLS